MPEKLSFGQLVTCEDPAILAALPSGSGPLAIIAELRRSDCRVQVLRCGRGFWVPLRSVRGAPPSAIAGTLEETIGSLLADLGATALELTRPDGSRWRLIVSHGAVTPAVVDRVRERLGSRLLHFVIRPQGMHAVQSVIEFTQP